MEQSYHHGDLKAQLIREGLKLLDREGYDHFSLRKAAKACNVSQTAPYRHFKDKDELIVAIAEQALEAFNRSLIEAVARHTDPKDALKEMGVAYVGFFADNPEYFRLMFFSKLDTCANGEMSAPDFHQKDGHPFATFFAAVQRYKAAYPRQTMQLDELVIYCWGLVHGIAALSAANAMPLPLNIRAVAERVIWSEKFLD